MSMLSSILDPIFGSDTSGEDAAAQAAIERASNMYAQTALPDLSIAKPEDYVNVGQVSAPTPISYSQADPRLASLSQQGPSAYNDIQVDPRLMNDQMSAIAALREVANNGGMSAADKANMARIQSNEAQADRGRREAILQNMGARGMGSSGNSLLAQLSSGQAATDRQAQQDMEIAGQAQANGLAAMLGAGNLAGSIGNQQFNQKAQVAAANDAINQFNTQNLNQNALANANIANQSAYQQAQGNLAANQFNSNQGYNAAARNADLLQNTANANTAARNQSAYDTSFTLPQQQYQNQMAKNAGVAGQAGALSSLYDNQATRKVNKDAGYMSSVLQGASIAAGA